MESFPNHKFKLYEGEQLADMVERIRQFGILLPVIIKENLTYDEAALIVTETNLRQRSFSDMSHSELAYCLAQHYEAMKSQGKRNDILAEIEVFLNPDKSRDSETCSQVENKLKSLSKEGNEYGLSKDKVARYIRISQLIEPLLSKVDAGEIAFLSAYELSFIEDKKIQEQIFEMAEKENYKIDMKNAGNQNRINHSRLS